MVKQKAKKLQEEPDDSFQVLAMDRRTVAEMDPEDRATWLSKACRLANEGVMRTSQLFDVLMSEKVVDGLPEKLGRRMMNTLKKHMGIFSEKQQKSLKFAPLIIEFDKSRREHTEDGSGGSSRRFTPASHDPEAADAMEEMMARCRDFVREKASSYDDRLKEVQEKEELERLEKERRQRKFEWEQIALWHQQLEQWEIGQLAVEDLRVQQRIREAEAARRQMEIRKEAERRDAQLEAERDEQARREVEDERRWEPQDERRRGSVPRVEDERQREEREEEDHWAAARRRAEEEYQRNERERLEQRQQEAERAAWCVAEQRQSAASEAVEEFQRAAAEQRHRESLKRHEDAERASEIERATARAAACAAEITARKRKVQEEKDQFVDRTPPPPRASASSAGGDALSKLRRPPVASAGAGIVPGGTLASLLRGSGGGVGTML